MADFKLGQFTTRVFEPRAARGSVIESKWRARYLAWVPIIRYKAESILEGVEHHLPMFRLTVLFVGASDIGTAYIKVRVA